MNWEPSDRFDEWPGCRACVHYARARCIAYPHGIPLSILSGEVDHMVPRPGQVGQTVFELVEWQTWRRTGQRIPDQAAMEQHA
jgi:hypothetical protein